MFGMLLPILLGLGGALTGRILAGKAKADTTNTGVSPLPEEGADPYAAYQRRKKRSGRADTILTGDVSPMGIGKRTLLG